MRSFEKSLDLGEKLMRRLSSIKSPYTKVKVTGRGLSSAFSIGGSHFSGLVTASRLPALMRKRGVLTFSVSNRVGIPPPLMIAEKDLWEGFDIPERSLNDLVHIVGEIIAISLLSCYNISLQNFLQLPDRQYYAHILLHDHVALHN